MKHLCPNDHDYVHDGTKGVSRQTDYTIKPPIVKLRCSSGHPCRGRWQIEDRSLNEHGAIVMQVPSFYQKKMPGKSGDSGLDGFFARSSP